MAITGNQHAITPARSGLLRSGAGRSGWPVVVGAKVPLYAQSGIARSGATRSNYHGPAGFVTIGGVQIGTTPTAAGQKLVGNIQILDALNEQPNRCSFRVRGLKPAIGQEVIVTAGSKNTLERLFAGHVLNVSHAYLGSPQLAVFDVNAIDYTFGLRQRIVSQRWLTTSATTIAKDLIAAGAPDYSAAGVVANLPTLDEFTITDQDVPAALSQLAKRIGGYWHVDYLKRVHLYLELDPLAGTDPTPLTPIHPTLTDLVVDQDGSQLVTRVLVEGGGSTALAAVVPGETLIPVVTNSWYEAAGGVVKAGPQRIRYTGHLAGGGGTLVGPGAAPAAVLTALATAGAGIESGRHEYAVAFVTASGESLVGPRTAVVVGIVAAPATAPVRGAIAAGVGPNPGQHYWAVTFVTAAGETAPGPALIDTIPGGVDVLAAPLANAPASGGAVEPGTFTYGVTFVTASGESTIGPASNVVTIITVTVPNAGAPTIVSNGPNSAQGDMIPGDGYDYLVTYSVASSSSDHTKETAAVSPSQVVTATASTAGGGKSSAMTVAIPYAKEATVQWVHVYRRNFSKQAPDVTSFRLLTSIANVVGTGSIQIQDLTGDSAIASRPAPPTANTTAITPTAIPVTNLPIGPSGVTSRKLYRSNGAGYRLVATIGNNTTASYTDTAPTGSLGAAPPTANTTAPAKTTIAALAIGGPDVTARKLYRSAANTSALQLAKTIADNTTTAIVDDVPDSGLGAAPPATGTAVANRVQLSALPIGTSAVTARKIYRTAAEASALKLLTTIADNTTTAYLDAAADATLGAAPAGSDTSGLQQPAGSVNAGSPTLIVAGAAAFRAAGGWAVIGNGQQVIRYTGISGNTLTGIPSIGPGAITASIAYNSTVTAAPMLVGIPSSGDGAIRYAIAAGDDVNLWITVDDAAAQAAAAALFGNSGIIEDVIQDRRLSATEARARGRAHLAQRKDLRFTVRYRSHDMNTRSGRTIVVNLLAAPYQLSAAFTIQTVRIHEFLPAILPQFDAEASSVRFTFEDLLRRVTLRTDPTG